MILNDKVESLKEKLIEATQEIIKIKSVEGAAKEGMPFGEGVAEALNFVLQVSEELGFKTANIDGYAGYAEYGEGEEYVGILGHLDVVPEGDGWLYPPYGAKIHEGKMYGRGTMDDKGPIMSALFALKAVKEAGLPLSKRVRVIFGTNEESGCKEMKYYLKKEKPPVSGFTPDAEYPIIYAEKGLTVFDLVKDFKVMANVKSTLKYVRGGHRPNMVPDFCEAAFESEEPESIQKKVEDFASATGYDIKAYYKEGLVIIESKGMSAHGSVPQLGRNAVMQLLACLGSLDIENNEASDFINFINAHIGMDVYGENFGVALEDEASGKLSFNVGIINMTESKVSLTLNLRYPVTFKLEDMMVPLEKRLEGTGIRVEGLQHQGPLYFPEDNALIKSLQKVYTEQTGQKAELLAIGGGTYAKEMPNIVAFGPLFPGKPDYLHQPNEYIEIDDLILNAKIYAHAIYELAK
jgi:succinyl-diaminopimelate desuccinylase